MKLRLLTAVPLVSVTETVPLVAPPGTVTVMLFVVDERTVAEFPLKYTALFAGVVENPLP
jgi:hypothetical protein